MVRTSVTRLIRWSIALAAGAALLAFVISRSDVEAVAAALGAADPAWILTAVTTVGLTLTLAVMRWSLLLAHADAAGGGRPSSWWTSWHCLVLGQAVNVVFPFRFGEGVRAVVTSRTSGQPVASVVACLGLERVLDMAAFGVILAGLLVAGAAPPLLQLAAPRVFMIAALTLVAIIAAIWLGPAAWATLRRRVGGSSRAGRWLAQQEDALRAGWSSLRRRPQVLRLALVTAAMQIASASTNYCVFRAVHLFGPAHLLVPGGADVPVGAALAVLIVTQFGTAVVSVPGHIGVFHYLVMTTLATWQVAPGAAAAAAVLLHLVAFGPRVILGAVAAGALGWNGRPSHPTFEGRAL